MGCHGPDRMTAVTKEIERGGGERRDTASREHMLSLREGMVAVCVDSSAHVCVCVCVDLDLFVSLKMATMRV